MPENTQRYHEVDGLRYIMEQRSLEKRKDQFPATNLDYVKIYFDLEEYMYQHIHKDIVLGAAINGNGLLNDHGKDHIEMVLNNADRLLKDKYDKLSGYEIFLLLVAIQFHDVGNVYGREKHEMRVWEIMKELAGVFPVDNAVKLYICQIAMAHGGILIDDKGLESKDTISELLTEDFLEGIKIKPAALACILRYADEISDDYTRSQRFLYQLKRVPLKNLIFHEYSNSLQPLSIEGNTLILNYRVDYKKTFKKFQKNTTSIFLYDEILSRLKKNLCELEYCKKFSEGLISLNAISVSVKIMADNKTVLQESFKLRIMGYPELLNQANQDLFRFATDCDMRRIVLNGELMLQAIKTAIGGKK